MRYKITFLHQARESLKEIISWYEFKQNFLGDEVSEEFYKKISLIIENPFLYQTFYKDFRKAIIHRFAVSIYFRVTYDNEIIISLISSDRKNPKSLIKKIKTIH